MILSFDERIRDQLYERVAELEDRYKRIDKVHQELNFLESESVDKEAEFNQLLKKYMAMKPAEHIEIVFIQYSTDARVRLDGESLRIDMDGEGISFED